MRSPLVVGAHVKCLINGQPFGRVAELGFDSATPQREVRGIDFHGPIELIDQVVSITGDMWIFKLHNDGGLPAVGMAAHWANLTRAKYWSLLVVDRVTETVLFRADACKTTRESWRYGRGHVMGSISFQGLVWQAEVGPS